MSLEKGALVTSYLAVSLDNMLPGGGGWRADMLSPMGSDVPRPQLLFLGCLVSYF
jgi:hypothetical protein